MATGDVNDRIGSVWFLLHSSVCIFLAIRKPFVLFCRLGNVVPAPLLSHVEATVSIDGGVGSPNASHTRTEMATASDIVATQCWSPQSCERLGRLTFDWMTVESNLGFSTACADGSAHRIGMCSRMTIPASAKICCVRYYFAATPCGHPRHF